MTCFFAIENNMKRGIDYIGNYSQMTSTKTILIKGTFGNKRISSERLCGIPQPGFLEMREFRLFLSYRWAEKSAGDAISLLEEFPVPRREVGIPVSVSKRKFVNFLSAFSLLTSINRGKILLFSLTGGIPLYYQKCHKDVRDEGFEVRSERYRVEMWMLP